MGQWTHVFRIVFEKKMQIWLMLSLHTSFSRLCIFSLPLYLKARFEVKGLIEAIFKYFSTDNRRKPVSYLFQQSL